MRLLSIVLVMCAPVVRTTWFGCAASEGSAGTAVLGPVEAGADSSQGDSAEADHGDTGSGGRDGAAGTSGQGDGSAGSAGQGENEAGAEVGADVDFSYDVAQQDTTLTPDSSCVNVVAEAKPVSLDIYLMLDRTGSMDQSEKWNNSKKAIELFTQSPDQAGNRLAFMLFDKEINYDCDGSFYAKPDGAIAPGGFPVGVGLTALPVDPSNDPIGYILDENSPNSSTPTEPALRGMVQFTAANRTAGRAMIGIFVTDGDPNQCATDNASLAAILSQQKQSTGIKTFIVGMSEAKFENLEKWAIGGGAEEHPDYCSTPVSPCHFYNIGNGDPAAFKALLQQISESAVACTYQMPTTDAGIIDPDEVSIEFTPGGQTTPQYFTRVQDASECTSTSFFYDNNAKPTTISFCSDTCSTVQASKGAKIQIMLGCLGS